MSPSTGPANTGTTVQITGTGFNSTVAVYFGSVKVTPSSIASTSVLNVVTPKEAAGKVAVSLVRGDGSQASLPGDFSFTKPSGTPVTTPLVASSLSPDTGTVAGNTSVQIMGSGFDSTDVVYFGATKVTPSSISSNSLIVKTPQAKIGDVPVYVERSNGTKAEAPGDFAYTDPLTIANSQLPNATVDITYSSALTASKGLPPYTWTLTKGPLPSGIALNTQGAVAGKPVTTGATQFTVEVSDQAGGHVTGAVTLDVLGASASNQLTSCQNLTTSNTTYVLQNDVSSTGTCFEINANNISLNLNGHTITYGTGGGTEPTPAITVCDSWYTGLPSGECGGSSHAAPTIYNGDIVQSSNAAPFSHVFSIGQGTNISNGYIHNITATFSATGTEFVAGDYPGPNWKIQSNTINDNVTNIQKPGQTPLAARSALQGYAIHLDNGGTPSAGPDDISNNTINGSPQGGISDGQPGSAIYSNTITLSAIYSNDYGVISMIPNQNIYGNTIKGAGRGLDAETSGFILNDNNINVAENNKNTEYNGCELDGTYGIRVKNYDWPGSTEPGAVASTNFKITNNIVTTPSSLCHANALDFTDLNSTVTGTVSGNTFSVPDGPSTPTSQDGSFSAAMGFEAAAYGTSVSFSGNKFTADTCVLIGGNGDISYGAFTVQSGQTWSCAKGPTVQGNDDTKGSGTAPVLTIKDTISNPTVGCVSDSTATVNIGSYTHTCN
jgi:hypothetical protein